MRLAVPATGACVLATMFLAKPSPLARVPATFFYSGGQRIPVRVVPDTIAVEADAGPGVERDARMRDALSFLTAAEIVRYSTLAEVDMTVLKTRPGRTALATEWLRGTAGGQAGFVVEVDRPGNPIAVVTPEFIVRFKPGVTRARIDEINVSQGAIIDRQDLFDPNQFVLRAADDNPLTALALSARYHDLDEVDRLSRLARASQRNSFVSKPRRGNSPSLAGRTARPLAGGPVAGPCSGRQVRRRLRGLDRRRSGIPSTGSHHSRAAALIGPS